MATWSKSVFRDGPYLQVVYTMKNPGSNDMQVIRCYGLTDGAIYMLDTALNVKEKA